MKILNYKFSPGDIICPRKRGDYILIIDNVVDGFYVYTYQAYGSKGTDIIERNYNKMFNYNKFWTELNANAETEASQI